MKKFKMAVLTIIGLLQMKTAFGDSWTQKTSFPGVARRAPFYFSINDNGYVGGGVISTSNYQQDFWEYDPIADSWMQKANFGGGPRGWASGFSIAGKGYAGFGYNSGQINNDLWEYDPLLNSWASKNPINGPYEFAVSSAFSINNSCGYICTGYNGSGNFTSDFWKYDPINNYWTTQPLFPGIPRTAASNFIIGDNAFVGSGAGSIVLHDFWKFNVVSGNWSQIADLPDTARNGCAGFAIGDKGYIGFGHGNPGGVRMATLWQYDTTFNLWTKKTTCPGSVREYPAVFVLNNKAYIGLGNDNLNLTDLWEYTPDPLTQIVEKNEANFSVYPNPLKDLLKIENYDNLKDASIYIYSLSGDLLVNQKLNNGVTTVDFSNFAPAVYLIEIRGENFIYNKKIVKY